MGARHQLYTHIAFSVYMVLMYHAVDQNGKYVLYFASPGVGRRNATIGVATSSSMDPGTWTDHGEVIRSHPSDVFNASKLYLYRDVLYLSMTL